jgi:hypothetical protein
MAISEVKNLTGGAVRDSHVKLFIAFEPNFLSGILNLGGLGCASMAGSAGVNWSAMNPGPTPNYEDVKNQAMKAIKRSLKDPNSAQFRDTTPIFKTLYNYGFGAAGSYEPLWTICVEVNAKNSFGGYNGFKYWFVKFRNGQAVQDSLGVSEGEYDCRNGPVDPDRITHG